MLLLALALQWSCSQRPLFGPKHAGLDLGSAVLQNTWCHMRFFFLTSLSSPFLLLHLPMGLAGQSAPGQGKGKQAGRNSRRGLLDVHNVPSACVSLGCRQGHVGKHVHSPGLQEPASAPGSDSACGSFLLSCRASALNPWVSSFFLCSSLYFSFLNKLCLG